MCKKAFKSPNLNSGEENIVAIYRDAMRYRMLRNMTDPDMGLPYVTIHKQNDWGKWYNTYEQGDDLDSLIDDIIMEKDYYQLYGR